LRLAGAGGFINISQAAKKVVFVGSFMAGEQRKFVREVEHRTFAGAHAQAAGKPVLYVTERCVFRLGANGLELIEVAPGVDVEHDIIAQMEFRPAIADPVATMEAAIFADAPMGLRERLTSKPLADRFAYDAEQSTLFIDFERLSIRTPADVEAVRREVESRVAPLGKKVYAIVNYDHFHLDPHVEDDWAQMVYDLVEGFYLNVTRYTTSGFLRAKLGPALAARGVAPHIYETVEEARAHLRD